MIDLAKDPKEIKMPRGIMMEMGKDDGPMYPCLYVDDVDIKGAKLGKEYTFKGTCTEIKQSEDGNCYKFDIKAIAAPGSSEEEREPEESMDEKATKFIKKKQKGTKSNDEAPDDDEAY